MKNKTFKYTVHFYHTPFNMVERERKTNSLLKVMWWVIRYGRLYKCIDIHKRWIK